MSKVTKLSSKGRGKRLPVFHEYPQLGALAFRRGFTTVKALAAHIEAHHTSVVEVLRCESDFPRVEASIAEALGVSVAGLRKLTQPLVESVAA